VHDVSIKIDVPAVLLLWGRGDEEKIVLGSKCICGRTRRARGMRRNDVIDYSNFNYRVLYLWYMILL